MLFRSPIYFKYFETSKIKVNPIPNQKSKIDNVFKAICYCKDNGLMEIIDGLPYLQCDNTQVWCVFDRDIEENVSENLKGNTSFDESIETAKARGFNVAWSNDAFELWILLHFEDVDFNSINKNRKVFYDRLTELFKSIPNPNIDLAKALNHSSFNYKQDCKSENNFRNIVRSEIVSKTKDAIARAKSLDELHSNPSKPHHEKSPCTMVHKLVEELIRLGGKEI